MTFHYRIFVVFVFDKISKGMLVTIEKELGEYFQRLHFWKQWVPLIKMHCRVHYLFDFDLKIRSGQVCFSLKFHLPYLYSTSHRIFFEIPPCRNMAIFVTQFVIWCKNPPFCVKWIRRKGLLHKGISKIFFLDHFSPSFLGQKWLTFIPIPFCASKWWLDLSDIVC